MKKPGFENSPSVTMSMPHSFCLLHDVDDGLMQLRIEGLLVEGLAGELGLELIEEMMRPRQAADMGRLNTAAVLLERHAPSSAGSTT